MQTAEALDQRDQTLIEERMANIREADGPQVGDFVRFTDGTLRRISYHWKDDEGWDGGVQTSKGGSFYLGNYGCSFSGSLYSSIPTETLTATDETMLGSLWVFHHDMQMAHNGVTTEEAFRVWNCEREANS